MRIQNISNTQSVQKIAFKSVLRTDNNEATEKLYALLKLNKEKKIDFMKKGHFGENDSDGSYLILVDDEKGKEATSYLGLEKELSDAETAVCYKTDEELEKMVPKEKVADFREELNNPLSAKRSRGNNFTDKLRNFIFADLSNEFMLKKEALYKEFLVKAKVISVSEIFDTIVGVVSKVKH